MQAVMSENPALLCFEPLNLGALFGPIAAANSARTRLASASLWRASDAHR